MSSDSIGAADASNDIGNMADFDGLDTHVNSFSSFTAQMHSFMGQLVISMSLIWF